MINKDLISILILATSFSVDANKLSFQFDSETYTEPQPIKAFVDDFDAPLKAGNSAFTYSKFELTYHADIYKVGFQSRFDYSLEFDNDTALYTFLEKNDLLFEQRDYKYKLTGQHLTSHGVFFEPIFKLEAYDLTISPKVSLFGAKHFQDADINGFIFSDSDQADLKVDYVFSKDRLFKSFSVLNRPQGIGASLDLKAEWQSTTDLIFKLRITDLFHQLKVKDAPFINGATSSIPFDFNAQGQINSEPSIRLSTFEGNSGTTSNISLPLRGQLSAQYFFAPQFSSSTQIRYRLNDVFFRFQGHWHMNNNTELSVGYQTKTQSFLIAIDSKYVGLSIAADKSSVDQLYYLDLGFQIKAHF